MDSLDSANFNAYNTDWHIESGPANPVNELNRASYVLRRISDNRYFKFVMEFTVLDDRATVQIDDLEGWDCGFSPLNCP